MKTEEEMKTIVFEAIGEASMCWSETPTGIFQSEKAVEIGDRVLKAIDESYTSNLWTSPCICPPDEKTGETLCCNICGKPTARTSEELLGDDDAGVIAVNVASNVIPKLTTQEEAFFIAGFQECVKYLRTSPLLASRDARTSKELPGDEEMKDWAEIHAIHCYHDGLISKKHFVEGYLYGVDFFKNNYASPLLASKDARIRELEEALRSIEIGADPLSEYQAHSWIDTAREIANKALTPPKN